MKKFFIIWFLLSIASVCFGTHIKGGQITIKVISGNTCQVTFKGFLRISSTVKFEGGALDFGDGSAPATMPYKIYISTLDPDVGLYLFTTLHTYPAPGFYTLSFFERNLDAGILNVSNSVDTPFYIESGILLDPLNTELADINFSADPVFHFSMGRPLSLSLASVDTSKINIYELIVPYQNSGLLVPGYVFPEGLQLNSQTGLLSWDTKFHGVYTPGEYLFVVRANQYDRKKKFLGFVERTFSIVLWDFKSNLTISNPVADPIGKVVTLAPEKASIKLIVSDSTDVDSLHWFSYYDPALTSYIHFSQYDSIAANSKMKVGNLSFTAAPEITRDRPYEVIFRGSSFSGSFAKDSKDISFLFFTRDIDWPVITQVTTRDDEVSVYPNPCTNELHIAGPSEFSYAEVYNTSGAQVVKAIIDADNRIDISRLPAGMYIFVLRNENTISRLKVIKK